MLQKPLSLLLTPALILGSTASALAQKAPQSIVSGVATNSRFVPATPPTIFNAPAGGCGIYIDFELTGPCLFSQTGPLTGAYAAMGVKFSGANVLDGGAVLDECGNFGANALSGTNFLAFNRNAGMNNGGLATDPESIFLANPASSASIYASGGFDTNTFQMDAFDAAGNLIASTGPVAGPGGTWTLLSVAAPGITTLVLVQGGDCCFMYDDLCIDGGGCNPIGSNYCGPANLNSSGQSATISACGSDVAANNNVRLDSAGMATNQFGMFLASMTQGFVMPPGSQGNLCLAGPGRYTANIQNTGPTGVMSLQLDLTNTPTPAGPVSVMAGESWYWQAWFRDSNPGSTSNFTDGICIKFL